MACRRDLDAAVRAGKLRCGDELTDGQAIHAARRESKSLDGGLSTCVVEGHGELEGNLTLVHEDKVVIRRGVREPPNPFAASDVFGLVFARGIDVEGDGVADPITIETAYRLI